MAIPDKTEAELRLEIKTLVQADALPVLSESQIDILVRQSFLPDTMRNVPDLAFERVGNKAYVVGQKMIPMNRNGHVYVCTTAGITNATEPTFPGDTEEVVIDGTAQWTENGVAKWTPTYDTFAAIGDGWEMKASMCVGNYAFSSDGQTFNRQQVYDHCMDMAKSWKRRKAGTTHVISEIKARSKVPDAFAAQLPDVVLEELGWFEA